VPLPGVRRHAEIGRFSSVAVALTPVDRRLNAHLTGWCNDPYDRHEHRWLTAGRPTALVSDGGVESQDSPPDGPFVVDPVRVEHNSVGDGDLRRAGEATASDAGQEIWSDTIARLPWP
jgi:hypothetical protein